MLRAIAYTTEVIPARPGKGIPRSSQMESIRQFAAASEIEVIAWFEDEAAEKDILKRPGVQAILAYDQPCDILLCERVRAFAGSMAGLNPFLEELKKRGLRLEPAASMWDCVSQQLRRRSRAWPVLPPFRIENEAATAGWYRVARPARLNFVNLVHRAPPSVSTRL